MNRFKTILPLLVFLGLGLVLWWGLKQDPHRISSPLLNKSLPALNGESLADPNLKIDQSIFLNKISLLNVFATWCVACVDEHSTLMDIAASNKVQLIGLDYKDQRQPALQWLTKYGNPYQEILFDNKGDNAMELGVYGTPETFLIDKQGRIRYKQIGPITQESWQKNFLPLIEKIENE